MLPDTSLDLYFISSVVRQVELDYNALVYHCEMKPGLLPCPPFSSEIALNQGWASDVGNKQTFKLSPGVYMMVRLSFLLPTSRIVIKMTYKRPEIIPSIEFALTSCAQSVSIASGMLSQTISSGIRR